MDYTDTKTRAEKGEVNSNLNTEVSENEMKYTIEPSKEEKDWAMFTHLSTFLAFLGIPLANIIAPVIMWQLKKDTMPFAVSQAKECINFQISLMIYAIVSLVLTLIFIGFLGLLITFGLSIVFTIIAALKANEGVNYKYPLTIRFIK